MPETTPAEGSKAPEKVEKTMGSPDKPAPFSPPPQPAPKPKPEPSSPRPKRPRK